MHVGLPNGATIQASHTALLPIAGPLPPLSLKARQAHVFPGLTGKSLVSIGQLCDDGYDAIFTATHVKLVKDGATTVVGAREPTNGL